MKKDAVAFLWSLINQHESSIHINKVKEFLTKEGFDEKSIEKALDTLYKLYFIEYSGDDDGNGFVIRKREILGPPFEDLPCLGCEHLHECHIGGDRYSPERCQYFEEWVNKLRNGFRNKKRVYIQFG